MTSGKGILIRNVYHMLAYAFQALRQSEYDQIQAEAFERIHELFSEILSRGIARQCKQGLYKEYIPAREDLPVKRGKIEFQGTISNLIQQRKLLCCDYDELSANNAYNQILKTTAEVLLRHAGLERKYCIPLKKAILALGGIDSVNPLGIDWSSLRYQRNNRNYQMLMNVCKFVLDGLLYSTDKGTYKIAGFLDDQHMSRLYEKFVLEFFRQHHPALGASSSAIYWALDSGPQGLLPGMQSDIMLRQGEKTLIIDTKYYARALQYRAEYDSAKLHSGNLYQIYAYVKNEDRCHTGTVGGMLLYAKTQESITPDCDVVIDGNPFSVRTLDLNVPFGEISAQLDRIAVQYFGKAG